MRKLVEVKVFEPERRSQLGEYKLDGAFSHPARFRYVNCWMEQDGNKIFCSIVGSQGWFQFVDGKCTSAFGGLGSAEIIGEIDEDRYMERDRFEEVKHDTNH